MKKTYKTIAQTLQYSGYDAELIENLNEVQPFEVHIKGIDEDELRRVTMLIWSMFNDSTINIIAATDAKEEEEEPRISFNWKTKKNEDGTFEGIVTKSIYSDNPINGRYTIDSIQARYKRTSRARAKSAAIQGMRFYRAELARRLKK